MAGRHHGEGIQRTDQEHARAGPRRALQSSRPPRRRVARQAREQEAAEVNVASEVLNVDQVAELLGLGRNTVYDAANRGEIPHRRVGRRLIFSRTAVMEWLQGKPARSEE